MAFPLAMHAQSVPQPAEFDEPIKCATPLILSIWNRPEKERQRILATLVGCNGRPIKSNQTISDGGHFRIHFDKSGPDGVPTRDGNADGVPDYIDSVGYYLEEAWRVEIGDYGFKEPTDSDVEGPEVDVYICDLSHQYYGYALPDDHNVISTSPYRVGGTLVLDNDYVGYPTPGYAGLAVTTAHEFNHIIQFSAYRFDLSQASLYESTAVWFEQVVHPEIHDYRNYTDAFLRSPQDYPYSTHNVSDQVTGYGHVLYLIYLVQRIARTDSAAAHDVVRHIWEDFQTMPCFTAINSALIELTGDLNLQESYCEFADWSYYTGQRAQDEQFFKDAPSYPTMGAAMIRDVDVGNEVFVADSLAPLAFGLYRFTVPTANVNIRDTVDLLVTNARSDIGAGGPQLTHGELFTLTLSVEPRPGYDAIKRGDSVIAYFKAQTANPEFCVTPIVGGERSMVLAVRTSPQPFMNDGASRMVIGLGENSDVIQTVDVEIFNSNMKHIRTLHRTQLEPFGSLLGVVWDGRTDDGALAASGVYIYELKVNKGMANETMALGKIAVVRR